MTRSRPGGIASARSTGTISIAEAARRAGVGPRAMKTAVATGQIPSILIGRRRRILLVPFEKLLTSGDLEPLAGPTV
jgi:hypothetical protein